MILFEDLIKLDILWYNFIYVKLFHDIEIV